MRRPRRGNRVNGRALLVLALALHSGSIWGWGYSAHRIVAENGHALLPPELSAWYEAGERALSDASIEPDRILKARHGKREKRRHYINLDSLWRPPFDDLPSSESEARALHGDTAIDAAGVLPWTIIEVLGRLEKHFREGDAGGVVRMSGWLSHYIADACQPLHVTSNHDGQLTGNGGIHAAFEAEMIHRRRRAYRTRARPDPDDVPVMIDDVPRTVRDTLEESFTLVVDVLDADTRAALAAARDGTDYFVRLEEYAGAVASDRLRLATRMSVNLWYTAWVRAGSPKPPAPPAPSGGN